MAKNNVWALYNVSDEVKHKAKLYQHQNNIKTLGEAVEQIINKVVK